MKMIQAVLKCGAGTFLLLLGLLACRPATASGRVLVEAELAGTTGDAALYCYKSFTCTTGLLETSGTTSICVYCAAVGNRTRCCEVDKGGDVCEYTGAFACQDSKRFVASTYSTGFCTCTATSAVETGVCG